MVTVKQGQLTKRERDELNHALEEVRAANRREQDESTRIFVESVIASRRSIEREARLSH